MSQLTQRLRPAVLTLAAREQGATLKDVMALDPSLKDSRQVYGVLNYLKKRGELHLATVTHKQKLYFTTAEAARRKEAANAHIRARSQQQHGGKGGLRAPWPADAPMVVTPRTRHIIVPTPPRALKTNTHSQF